MPIVAVTGFRGTGRTTAYNHAKRILEQRHPGRVHCVGNLFNVPHPLRNRAAPSLDLAMSSLLDGWSKKLAALPEVRVALAQGKLVFADTFGPDVCLDAAAYVRNHADLQRIADQHHEGFVELFLRGQVPLPFYKRIVLRLDAAADRDRVLRHRSSLTHVSEAVFTAYMRGQEWAMQDYFGDRRGQNPSDDYDGTQEPEVVGAQIADDITMQHIEPERELAAD